MAVTSDHGKAFSLPKGKAHLLIIEARFYDDLADALLDGAKAALDEAGATYDVVTVPGALEIPAVISFALDGAEEGGTDYDGFVALGTVIRGETYHFDIVANESSRGADGSGDRGIARHRQRHPDHRERRAGLGARPEKRGRQGRLRGARGAHHDRAARAAGSLTTVTQAAGDQPNIRQANKRGAARLAAVQALYQMDVAGSGLLEIAAEYEAFRLGKEVDGAQYREADAQWFRAILSGVVENQKTVDPVIRQALTEDWPLSRLDSTLRAILRAGVYELMKREDVPVAVIVSEYVDIAKAFYSEDEPKLVNAVLDRVSRRVRGEGRGKDAS